jgi:hypothetical protein
MAIRALVLTVAAAGLGLWLMGPAEDHSIDPIISAALASGDQEYTVSNMENGTACLLTRGRQVSSRSSAIRPGSDCTDVWPGLAEARNWTRNDDGTVILSDNSGSQILTLSLGDGVDFETLEPANALLAFNALN